MSYVLYSSLEALSRSFIATENLAGYEVVDWPKGDRGDLVSKGISPSSFPAVAYLLPANIAMPELWVVIPANSITEAESTRDAMITKRTEQAETLPPLPVVPDYDKFLYLLANDPITPLEALPFLGLFSQDKSSIIDDAKRYRFFSRMVGENKAYFVSDIFIAKINEIAALCNVTLSDPQNK